MLAPQHVVAVPVVVISRVNDKATASWAHDDGDVPDKRDATQHPDLYTHIRLFALCAGNLPRAQI